MSDDRWQRIEEVFQQAADLPEAERDRFLAAACAGDDGTRREIESLLAHDQSQNDVLVAAISEAVGELPDELLNSEAATTEPEPGDLLDPSVTLGTQTGIGRYRLLHKVGEGGMGEVWLAEQREPVRRRAALKLVKAGMNTPEVIARFESERQALALMDHPAIAKVFDAGSTPQGAPYFVMEYVAGLPITAYCDTHRLSTRARLELVIQVCEGVQHAHQKAIIHRDLKPSNILVTEMDGRPVPKIIDFGVAKALAHKLTADTIFTRMGALIGTPEYMSPEQALSSSEDVDTRTDVYSLGIILYELLAGVPPIDPRKITIEEFLRRLREEDPPKPSTKIRSQDPEASSELARKRRIEPAALAKQIRGDLDSIALKALEKDRSRRYGSPSELAADIRRYLAGLPIAARKQTLGYRSLKFVRRHKVATGAAALVAFSLLGGMGATLWEAHVARQERARAERRFNDVRDLANSLMFEVHDAIQTLPGATEARRLIVDRALKYLNRLAGEPLNDNSLRREVAAAYLKLGQVQGDAGIPNLGDTRTAAQSFRRAVNLLEEVVTSEPSSIPDHRALANGYDKLAQALWEGGDRKEAENLDRKALRVRQALSGRLPELELNKELIYSYHNLGGRRVEFGDLSGALENYQKCLDACQKVVRSQPDSPVNQRSLSLVHKNIGGVLIRKGQLADALDHYRTAQIIDEERITDDPDNTVARMDVTFAYSDIGFILREQGNLAAALANYRKVEKIRSALVAADPKDARARSGLASTNFNIGRILWSLKQRQEAIGFYEKAQQIRESLLAGDPASSPAQFLLASTCAELGAAYAALAQSATEPDARLALWRRALPYYQRATQMIEALRAKGPLIGDAVETDEKVARELRKCKEAIDKLTTSQVQ
jgi:non-specific serine/threonine protein kinase/serine/threonine-protein kinase